MVISTALIQDLVKRAGSQERLARLIGVSWISVHRWANGKNLPKSPVIVRRLEEVVKELSQQISESGAK